MLGRLPFSAMVAAALLAVAAPVTAEVVTFIAEVSGNGQVIRLASDET